ncbi:ribosome maturation factor RimP [Guggenheimella bovis]
MHSVVELVTQLLEDTLKENNLELYDVEFVKEGADRYLRIYLDKLDRVTIEDCEKVSRFLSKELDRLDPIKEQYFLEVSSAGAERDLKKDADFIRFMGKPVSVSLLKPVEGLQLYRGILVSKDQETLTIKNEHEMTFECSNIKKVRTILE